MAIRRLVLAAVLLGVAAGLAGAAGYVRATNEELEWFRQARFGMFVHWGPVSLTGGEISWSRGGLRRGMPAADPTFGDLSNAALQGTPVAEYDALYRRFDPSGFDARQWVAIARAAGMKYIVLTTKHHDGFCLFDSAHTDYDIMATPYGRDLCRQLADACHEAGLRLGWYYSPADWHHPDYYTERHDRYIEYLHDQVAELLTKYGRVDVMWFDSLFCTADRCDSARLWQTVRRLQPGILINNRLPGVAGDFDTPEQTVGRFQRGRAWESCITLGSQWAWGPGDRPKSLGECIGTLVRCAGGDGNLLLNVGPRPDGRIDPAYAARLGEIGAWLRQYGESIYGTRGGPFLLKRAGASTYRGNTVYLHLLEWPSDRLVLPPMAARVTACRLLTGGEVTCRPGPEGTVIDLRRARRAVDTIVALTLDRSAAPLQPVALVRDALSTGRPARASTICNDDPQWGPDRAVDDNPGTRWATNSGVTAAWLEVDLGTVEAFNQVTINEAIPRVTRYRLLCRDREADEWRVLHTGTTIGESCVVNLGLVRGRYVRLDIGAASDGPTCWEFQVGRVGR